MSIVAENTEAQKAREFYYAEVGKLPIRQGDCDGIWWTTDTSKPLRCVYVQIPDKDWTVARARDQLDLIKADLKKIGQGA